ncbi:MAG: thioredoxin-dependent thiol peroxidase [Planctomycetota bacterium]|nr:thioredoxin-dependent thiol peroxidase [Planctomycetota bacterium]
MPTTKMPAWKMPSSDGGHVASKDLKGSPYILYFYPRDSTPGCTTEACDFRDNMARLTKAGVKVFGVSRDSLASHAKFIDKQSLNFPLLVDEGQVLMEKIGVWGLKKFMGRESMGIIRSTFLVDGTGKIVREWRKVKVKGHVDEVISAVADLG